MCVCVGGGGGVLHDRYLDVLLLGQDLVDYQSLLGHVQQLLFLDHRWVVFVLVLHHFLWNK